MNNQLEEEEQKLIDWYIALKFQSFAYATILSYASRYKIDKYKFYIDKVKSIKSDLEEFNHSKESMINNLRLNLIIKCDEAIAEMEAQ